MNFVIEILLTGLHLFFSFSLCYPRLVCFFSLLLFIKTEKMAGCKGGVGSMKKAGDEFSLAVGYLV
jgi:hypothetical protein